jgi:hypothetical protein
LNFPPNVHDLPENYLKLLPNYDGEKTISAKEHMGTFQDFIDKIFVEHDDVFMKIFVQNLEGDFIKWFRELLAASIGTWKTLESTFMRHWGEKIKNLYYLTEFGSLKKRTNEAVFEFNIRFNRLYNRIHRDIKPSQPTTKVPMMDNLMLIFPWC